MCFIRISLTGAILSVGGFGVPCKTRANCVPLARMPQLPGKPYAV
ncbi:TPA: hypothetical protein ACJJHS_001249 [Neisseria meningitidis]